MLFFNFIIKFQDKKTDLRINAKVDQVFEHLMKYLNIEVDTKNFDLKVNNIIKESTHKLQIIPKKRKPTKRKVDDSD